MNISLAFELILFCIVVVFQGMNLQKHWAQFVLDHVGFYGPMSKPEPLEGGIRHKVFYFGEHPLHAYYHCRFCRSIVTLHNMDNEMTMTGNSLAFDKREHLLDHVAACARIKTSKAKRKNHVILFAK